MAGTRQSTLFDNRFAAGTAYNGRTFAEFFAGIGLVRLGLERSGWQIRLANDMDPLKLKMYEGHFGPAPYYCTDDIHELAKAPERVPDILLAHASFPCTDLSVAGARRGLNAGESSAFWGFERLLEAMDDRRPPLVLLENVTGFLTSHEGRDFRAALVALNRLGYSVDAFIVDAAHFVPQSRARLFVLAKTFDGPLDPVDLHRLGASPLRPEALLNFMRRQSDINWDVRELPPLPPYGATRLESILDNIPADSPQWWSDDRVKYLCAQMSARHKAIVKDMKQTRRWTSGTVFRRVRKGKSMGELRTDGIAGCLRTPKGGSGRQILFQAGYGRCRARLLNPAECARLMGADGFQVTVPLNQALFGFGDAVCADVIDWIARHYLNPMTDSLLPVTKPVRSGRHRALTLASVES